MTEFTGAIHPVADLFPMLADDELRELAEDIKERGLLFPIVLDPEGQVLDGRNRLAACNLAGLQPQFTTYEGDDPAGFALSANIARRHLTKGQQAMILIQARSVSDHYASNEYQSLRSIADKNEVSQARLKTAALVFNHAPELVPLVISGHTTLDSAYRTAQERKTQAEEIERRINELKAQYADLEELIRAEELSRDEAFAEQARRNLERERADKERADYVTRFSTSLLESVEWLVMVLPYGYNDESPSQIFDKHVISSRFKLNKDSIGKAIANLESLRGEWKDD